MFGMGGLEKLGDEVGAGEVADCWRVGLLLEST